MSAEPTLDNLLDVLDAADLPVVDSGEDRHVPAVVRKILGAKAGPARAYAVVRFPGGGVIERTDEVFKVVNARMTRGDFSFETARDGEAVAVVVTRDLSKGEK